MHFLGMGMSLTSLLMVLMMLMLVLMRKGTEAQTVAECEDRSTVMRIEGAGSSFPSPLYQEVGPLYAAKRSTRRTIDFFYDKVNSGFGKKAIKMEVPYKDPILYAGTESLLTKTDKKNHPQLLTFPMLAGALVVVLNLPQINSLNLSIWNVADIYEGKLRKWNDPEIIKSNPGVDLPNENILPVVRSDNGGDTEIFTTGLSSFSTTWQEKYGIFINPEFVGGVCCESTKWPRDTVKYFGKRVTGMLGIVSSIPYTIGYSALSNAEEFGVTYATLINRAGKPTLPTSVSVMAAQDYHVLFHPELMEFGLSDALLDNAYPLASFSYAIVNASTHSSVSCCLMIELVGFIEWFLYESDTTIIEKFYLSPLSDKVRERIRDTMLKRITCKGTNVYQMMQESIDYVASEGLSSSQLILVVTGVCMFCIGLVLFMGFIYQKRISSANASRWYLHGTLFKFVDLENVSRSNTTIQSERTTSNVSRAMSRSENKSRTSFDSRTVHGALADLKFSGEKATYEGETYLLERFGLKKNPKRFDRKTQQSLSLFKHSVAHGNVLHLMGVTELNGETWLVSDMAEKGTLHFVLQTTPYQINQDIRYSLAQNICDGVLYLHRKKIYHGCLNSLNCYVDRSWNVKVGNWARSSLVGFEDGWQTDAWGPITAEPETTSVAIQMTYIDGQLVMLPGSVDAEADGYGMGMLLLEIFTGQAPYTSELNEGDTTMSAILQPKFDYGTNVPPLVPNDVPKDTVKPLIHNLTNSRRDARLPIKDVALKLAAANTSKKGIVDIMMKTMEVYTKNLEVTVQERTADLELQSSKMKDLLSEVLPPEVSEKLYRGETVEPEYYDIATIFFSDICGFTSISAKSTPLDVINFLDDLWILFDGAIEKYDVYKVDTIGDAYMVASGLPNRNDMNHAKEISSLSLDLLEACAGFKFRHLPDEKLKVRIGVNSGPVTTGVVGAKMPQYCIFGETVNTASKMEQTSSPMRIQVTENTAKILTGFFPQFDLTPRTDESITKSGGGEIKTFWLNSVKHSKKAQQAWNVDDHQILAD